MFRLKVLFGNKNSAVIWT